MKKKDKARECTTDSEPFDGLSSGCLLFIRNPERIRIFLTKSS